MGLTVQGSNRGSSRIVEAGYGANTASSLFVSAIFAWSRAARGVNWTAYLNRVRRVAIRVTMFLFPYMPSWGERGQQICVLLFTQGYSYLQAKRLSMAEG